MASPAGERLMAIESRSGVSFLWLLSESWSWGPSCLFDFVLHTASSFSNTPHPIVRVSLLNYASPFEMHFSYWRVNEGIFLEKCDRRHKYKPFHYIYIISLLSWAQFCFKCITFFPPPYIFLYSLGCYLTFSAFRSCLRISCYSGSWASIHCLLILFPDITLSLAGTVVSDVGWDGETSVKVARLAELGAKHWTDILMFLLPSY